MIPKTASGTSDSTNIEYVLLNLEIKYLIVYGVVTDLCMETTIRDAADEGFVGTQIEACCAAFNAENHERSVESMRGHYCRARTTDEIILEFANIARNPIQLGSHPVDLNWC